VLLSVVTLAFGVQPLPAAAARCSATGRTWSPGRPSASRRAEQRQQLRGRPRRLPGQHGPVSGRRHRSRPRVLHRGQSLRRRCAVL